MPPSQDLTGRLLAATPDLGDPNFERTVVLLLEHGPEGALGVVINRPSPIPVADLLPAWTRFVVAPEVLFQGGPVQPDGVLALAEAHAGGAVVHQQILPGIASLDLDADADLAGDSVRRARFFAGYSGWAPGQLEAEIELGSWFTVGSDPGDLFLEDMDALWERVVRRQGGTFATFPSDVRLN